MAYENLCMYCFKDLHDRSICPHCGKDARAAVPQIQMLPGSQVYRDRFLVGRALGQDAGGIVYNALDTKRGGTIRIREYLPRNCAERLNDGAVVPIAGMEDAFEAGMRKLRASVESVEDPSKRHFYFEENGTAYIAQRKNAAAASARMEMDDDDDEGRSHIALYIAIGAAVVLAVVIGVIWFLTSMSDPKDMTLDPIASSSPGATWMPAETPSPTPYATATFAALKDPELSWMDYTYNGNVNSDYQQQVQANPTKKPFVQEEPDYDTINGNSNRDSVRELQERLVELGWLDDSDANGRYNAATKQAVKDFQNYVNEYCSPAKKLAVDGIAGEKTQQWLYNASVSLTRPTPTPKPLVTPAPDDSVVNENSPARDVRALQKKLILLGLMKEGSADGEYGAATTSAVRNFQIRVNQLQGYNAVEVSGKVDELTMAYLNYYVDWWEDLNAETQKPEIKPTETPETKPTPTATASIGSGSVNADSSRAEITAMQELLEQLGLLDADDVDGVYGRGTTRAIEAFQRWVNEQRKEETLKVNGKCDAQTMAYLKYCVENGFVVQGNTAEPTAQPTPEPTQVPTAVPTSQPTPEPTEVPPPEQAGENGVTPDSPRESIRYMQEMLAAVGLLDEDDVDGRYGSGTEEAVRTFQQFFNEQRGEEALEVSGMCDQLTLESLQYCFDRGWNLSDREDQPEATEAPDTGAENAGAITPDSSEESIGYMQEMLCDVGLLEPEQIDGDYGKATKEAIAALQQFVNDQKGERVLEITGICDPLTLQYLTYCYEQGWNLADRGDAPEADPTQPPIAEPTREPEAEVGRIDDFTLYLQGEPIESDLLEVDPGQYQLNWNADGDVQSYYLYLYDGSGNLIRSSEGIVANGFNMDTTTMKPGEVYELRIGALPMNGTSDDIVWQVLRLIRTERATPEPTAEPTPRPSVGKPSINIGSSVYQQDGVPFINDSTIIFSWMADGDVEDYTVHLVYADGTKYSLGETTDTSKTVSADQLQPGLYKLYVGAKPYGGGEDDIIWNELLFGVPEPEMPDEPEDDPTNAPSTGDEPILYLDANSDPEDIQTVQMALYRLGLLNTDNAEPGLFDHSTLEAIASFQIMANDLLGYNLAIIDLSTPIDEIFIDESTIALLLDPNLDLGAMG